MKQAAHGALGPLRNGEMVKWYSTLETDCLLLCNFAAIFRLHFVVDIL